MPVDPATMSALLAVGGTALNVGSGAVGQARQNKQARKLLDYQNWYNSPAQQMYRFKQAGLNPNLIYGQGNAGNWSGSPPASFADYQSGATDRIGEQVADTILKVQQSRLLESQRDLTDQKVVESTVKADLVAAQKDLVRANPLMKPEYVDSMVRQLKAAADLKAQESQFMTNMDTYQTGADQDRDWETNQP